MRTSLPTLASAKLWTRTFHSENACGLLHILRRESFHEPGQRTR
jgi:hypothetical protein